jgi:hypothetical protein
MRFLVGWKPIMKNRNAAKWPGGKKANENLLAKTGGALRSFWN